jgi:Terminase RNaseH-like domain
MTLSLSSPLLEDLQPAKGCYERYVVGVDLGQSYDPTAIAAVRRVDDDQTDPIFQVGHLQRLPLNTPYPGVVRHVATMLNTPRLRNKSELVIDYTGVGRPVFDMFQVAGISPIGVSIHAGDAVTHEGRTYKVPKLILISGVQALLHSGRLKIQKNLPDAPALVAELQDFRGVVSDTGYWKFGARSGKHDDLVLAVAIALWRANGGGIGCFGTFEYYRRLAQGTLSLGPPSTPAPDVVLKAPAGSSPSVVLSMSGQRYPVVRGCITATADDAVSLVQNGWKRVEQAPEAVK